MQNDTVQEALIAEEALDVMRNFVATIRAVKLYPANNPIYSQSIKKSFEVLKRFLEKTPEYRVGVQSTCFTYGVVPVGRDAQIDLAVAQDAFAKGVREILFLRGVTEEQLQALYLALALSQEELAMKSGISSVLWEKGVSHIKVTESGLDEVISTTEDRSGAAALTTREARPLDPATAKKEVVFGGRSLFLGDLMDDPAGFGASMLALAEQTAGEHESIEDRLYDLYREGGRKIRETDPDQSDVLLEGLAQSVLLLEPPYREKIIAGKLYRDMDMESVHEQKGAVEEPVPNKLHETLTGRFSNAWTVEQVKELLIKSSAKPVAPTPSPFRPTPAATFDVIPLSQELAVLAHGMSEYSPKEMEALQKKISTGSMEQGIIEAAVRTMLFLMNEVKRLHRSVSEEEELKLFSKIVHQLEGLLSYFLKKKDYMNAAMIGRAFHMHTEPRFEPRLTDAVKKMASRPYILDMINALRYNRKGSAEYTAAYGYLLLMEREATEALLDLLAEEEDRLIREIYLDLVKELGRNQIMLIGEHLSDERWYFVRNIVSILGEGKSNEVIPFLHSVAGHPNLRIRQEVVKGLILIGGEKAARLLVKFLNDKDEDLRWAAVRGIAGFKGIGSGGARPLIEFLKDRPLKRSNQELVIEVINTLGKIGRGDAVEFLQGYTHVKWWRSRALQGERRAAALKAIEEIKRRGRDGGRAR